MHGDQVQSRHKASKRRGHADEHVVTILAEIVSKFRCLNEKSAFVTGHGYAFSKAWDDQHRVS